MQKLQSMICIFRGSRNRSDCQFLTLRILLSLLFPRTFHQTASLKKWQMSSLRKKTLKLAQSKINVQTATKILLTWANLDGTENACKMWYPISNMTLLRTKLARFRGYQNLQFLDNKITLQEPISKLPATHTKLIKSNLALDLSQFLPELFLNQMWTQWVSCLRYR